MPQNTKAGILPASDAASSETLQRFETSVRALIANGKSKTALENAKQFHKTQHTAASESLLLEAYSARIQSLLDQNLATEAKSLIDIVRERFPSAHQRLTGLMTSASARGGELKELLQPLTDPELSAERRAAIEQAIQNQVANLTALADCEALPPDHNLRQAARALDQAFELVTSGRVTDDQIALPEVSHRSPLAPWKVLIRAIACFYRGEDKECRECLEAIKPESVPSRLVPAMRAMLSTKFGGALKPAEASLVSSTVSSSADLRRALADLDRQFAEEADENRIYKTVREVVRECERGAPDLLAQLKQLIFARCGVACLDMERMTSALGGAPRQDAAFFRMYARALENTGEPEDLTEACEQWDRFRTQAVAEGWFPPNGVEAATLYLHMASLLTRVPDDELFDAQHSGAPGRRPGEVNYFLFPERLFARACVLDPHPEGFSQWLRWATGKSVSAAEDVCRQWNKIRPDDLEPLLYLMQQAEKRKAFPTALGYLDQAERIDAVHSVVRAARLRLLAAVAIRHLEQKKPHLAEEKLALLAALPQSRQGDRPAFLAAMRQIIAMRAGDKSKAEAALLETQAAVGSPLAAMLLIFGLAAMLKRLDLVFLPSVEALRPDQLAGLPMSLAKVIGVVKDFGIAKFKLPVTYFAEAEAQFPRVRDTFDVPQLLLLAGCATTEHPRLTWAAAETGLARGGPSEPFFLLARATAMPPGGGNDRYVALVASAAALGRFYGEKEVVARALTMLTDEFDPEPISVSVEQAREVIRRELASPEFPTRFGSGPDYSDLVSRELCQCPNCRRARGEEVDDYENGDVEFDEADMERVFNANVPPDMPRAVAKALFEVVKESFLAGETPDETFSKIFGEEDGRGSKKKGSKKR